LSLSADTQERHPQHLERLKPIVVLAALGIVYGDIGTSPLYVFQAITKINGGHFDEASALGSLSLIFWTLIIVVSLKYALVVMRADNRGEGGILALMSLTRARWRGRNRYLACGPAAASTSNDWARAFGMSRFASALSKFPTCRALHQEKSKCTVDLDNAIYFSGRDRVVTREQKPRLAA
jgi:hypothetical protein